MELLSEKQKMEKQEEKVNTMNVISVNPIWKQKKESKSLRATEGRERLIQT